MGGPETTEDPEFACCLKELVELAGTVRCTRSCRGGITGSCNALEAHDCERAFHCDSVHPHFRLAVYVISAHFSQLPLVTSLACMFLKWTR